MTLFTNLSASAPLNQYWLILWPPSPLFSSILFAKSTCVLALKLPFLYAHSFFRHPTIITPSAPDIIAKRRCLRSTLPVHLSLIIFTEGVYFRRDTPARSAALYPHFKQANMIIFNCSSICLNTLQKAFEFSK